MDRHRRSDGESGCAMGQLTIIAVFTFTQMRASSFMTAFRLRGCCDLFIRYGNLKVNMNRPGHMIYVGVINCYR